MKSKYYIKALTNNEILSLLSDKKFNSLHPVKCNHCGNTTDFTRKIFIVDSKPKNIDENERQSFLIHYMKQNKNFDSIFFKISNNINYIDTAFCKVCNSNKITYDIELGDEVFEEMSKFLNVPKEILQDEMRKIHDSIKKGK